MQDYLEKKAYAEITILLNHISRESANTNS